MLLRAATTDDIAAIADIYAHHVTHGTGSFELEPPTTAEMTARQRDILALKLPYLVAEDNGDILGYAYAGPYRPRLAYRFTVEDSVYIHPVATSRGIGKLLLNRLIDDCTALGLRQMVAVIGDAENKSSINLHKSLGFTHTGTLKDVGFKFGRWLDVVLMQRQLGAGAHALPA
ncbi:MAG: GNAT family N-acetyltransferase [Micavibrio sp.]|nr:GNAT family N-acetyltransferase [Micavibrio sp.]